MAADKSELSKRITIARRWQWPAAVALFLFFLSCFIGWPLDYFWPSAIGLVFSIPAIMLLNIKCNSCGFPAFSDYQADERQRLGNRFRTPFWGKEVGGVHMPLRSECSKCGARFVKTEG